MAAARTDTWDPDQYERFAAERRRPFEDLLGLVRAVPGGRAVDLGCGTGELTAHLHAATGAGTTIGVDSSPAMLARAAPHAGGGVSFEHGDIATWRPAGGAPLDVVFSNAALHWVPAHGALLTRLRDLLAPGGQLAFQVPANHDHPSHVIANELGAERGLRVGGGAASVLAPEAYAELLHALGFADQHVRLQVYGFDLPGSDDVVEWTKGTLLTAFREQLDDESYADFEAEYRRRLRRELGDHRPYFYAFKRILAWGARVS